MATRCRCTADRKDTAATPASSAACLVLIFRIREDISSTLACRSLPLCRRRTGSVVKQPSGEDLFDHRLFHPSTHPPRRRHES